MGTVYLAARADETFQKLVAIKIIRRGLDTEDIIQRFRSERQILATLDHPNITRLLDGGTTDDGLPYFVMEYIEGEPIDKYCEQRNVNVAERLRIFQSVCSAVRYAHQNLVVHRDIKPGNVLVTKEGVPRLLDFGIAKLLAPGTSPEATLNGPRPLTPEYASPEQLRGEPITTASDVYSLGVLLYELLTGKKPYRPTGGTAGEGERVIRASEPTRPSVAAGPTLGRRLRGDVDNIILMAMRQEPHRRYSSVEQFSEDIRRHLDGLPVIARADTLTYRTTKFVARHKAGVIAAALLLITLSAGIVATLWQARVARKETAKAQRINAFLQEMLSSSSPGYDSASARKDPDMRISEVVAASARRAETELADQPEVLAEIQRTIGAAYYAQGHYEQAEQILRAALKKYAALFGDDSPETVEASNALANVLLQKGNAAEAEALFRKNIDIERREAQRGHPEVRAMAHALGDYGSMLELRDDKSAGAYLREALQYASRLTGMDRAFVAMIENDLSNVATREGHLKEAERLEREAIDEYRKLPEGTYAEMGAALSNLGNILITQGKYKDAEPFVRESLELRRKVLGDSHQDTAKSLYRLSELLYSMGDYAGAEKAARESIAVFRRALAQPMESVNFSSPLRELGLILNKTGRSREGEIYLRQSLAIRTHLLPSGSQLIANTEATLGDCLIAQKRYAEAEPFLLDSYQIALKATGGMQDSRTAEPRQRLKTLYEDWHKPEKAASY
jgi:serine/threonine-protein kinase